MGSGRLAGKVAFVTGGTSNIGLGIARRFLAEGAAVTVAGRDPGRAAEAAAALAAELPGASVLGAAADVTDPASLEAALDASERAQGPLDILVCSAGVGVVQLVSRTTEEDWRRVIETNLTGTWRAARLAMPRMAARGGGSIVTVGSDAALDGERKLGAYSVSKAAVVMLTRMLALDGAPDRIRANCICPGFIAPGMRDFPDRIAGEEEGDTTEGIPLPPWGRHGTSADVASAAVWLASDEARFVTGIALPVEGGITAGIPEYGEDERRRARAAGEAEAGR